MRQKWCAAALAVSVSWLALGCEDSGAGPAPADTTKPSEAASAKPAGTAAPTAKGKFTFAIDDAKDPELAKVQAYVAKKKLFADVVEELNGLIKLPKNIEVHTAECGTVNAFFTPDDSKITMCYELLGYFQHLFGAEVESKDELAKEVEGAAYFVFFHEVGHALVHTLGLPVTGKEEDAVDQLSVLVLHEAGEEGEQMALAGANWFFLQSEKQGTGDLAFWGEHSLDQQRFYNILCLLYGANPEKYKGMVSPEILPEDRAVRCPDEAKKIAGAWEKILDPHLTAAAD